jgi:hypothetical protein
MKRFIAAAVAVFSVLCVTTVVWGQDRIQMTPDRSPEEPESSTTQSRSATKSGLGSGLRGFGQIAVGSFFASQSFDAVLGSAPLPGHIRAPWWGGGAQFQFRGGAFFEGGVGFFRQTGQRVFVDGGTVFQLGIPDTVTVMPVMATIGYRFRGRSVAPFIGGGAGQYLYAEKTPFDQSAEFAWHHAASVDGLGGVEFRAAHNIAIAVQGQYTRVPRALAGGTASTFKESDLGGIQLGVKVLLGFPQHQRDPMTNR